ncbi:MAG: YkgJ family cysteine cluster protein [Acidobacteriota bacterium]
MVKHPVLQVLHGEIASRTAATVTAQPEFPCRKGCDHCCRHLASLPLLTEPEWELLREGIAQLGTTARVEIEARLAALGPLAPRPVVCPLLDTASGACLVYAHRPTACRTYGFYVERDKGLYCGEIQTSVERGELNHIVWGNHSGIEGRLGNLGPARSLDEWAAATLPVE